MSTGSVKGSALPKTWIVPIRLAIYSVLAACSGYIYFNLGELEFTHYLVITSIAVVAAMALLDCKMSSQYWEQESVKAEQRDQVGSKVRN